MASGGTSEQVAALQLVTRMLEDRLDEALDEIPVDHQPLVANALLNLAIDHVLAEETALRTATMLYRLADLIANGHRPDGGEAIPLTGSNA